MRLFATLSLLVLLSTSTGCSFCKHLGQRFLYGMSDQDRAQLDAYVARNKAIRDAKIAKRRQAWVDAATPRDRARWGKAVLAGEVPIGMPWGAVIASIGEPGGVRRHTSSSGETVWFDYYSNSYRHRDLYAIVTFSNGLVSSMYQP